MVVVLSAPRDHSAARYITQQWTVILTLHSCSWKEHPHHDYANVNVRNDETAHRETSSSPPAGRSVAAPGAAACTASFSRLCLLPPARWALLSYPPSLPTGCQRCPGADNKVKTNFYLKLRLKHSSRMLNYIYPPFTDTTRQHGSTTTHFRFSLLFFFK